MALEKKLEALNRVYKIYDAYIAAQNLACKAKCAHCCTTNVTMTTLEGYKIFHDLIATDKQEIIDEAQAIGAFDVSIEPDQDCCKLFLPKKPSVAATVWECEAAEEKLDVDALVTDGMKRTETQTFKWPT